MKVDREEDTGLLMFLSQIQQSREYVGMYATKWSEGCWIIVASTGGYELCQGMRYELYHCQFQLQLFSQHRQ